jgi:glycosyltransferase involved in cell wall biosynthesis
MNTLVIIPAYNEENTISKVIDEIRQLHCGLDILVVSDGSQDKTAQLARQKNVSVVEHPFNMGYGVAVHTGYKYAAIHSYDYLIQMDADGQHDPNYIKRLLEELRGGSCDIVVGSRFLSGGSYSTSMPRKIGMYLSKVIVGFILRAKISDPTSGFQALNKRAFEFCAENDFPEDFADANVLIWLALAGFKIQEVPVKMYNRSGGPSKYVNNIFNSAYYIYKVLMSILVVLTTVRIIKMGRNYGIKG